ncbi:MAG: acyl-CoA thioesterase [Stellaceae bacterium]
MNGSETRSPPPRRAEYPHFLAIPTRWMDNDIYGHLNNVVYYSYFDTVVNHYLIESGGLDIHAGPVIGLVVETLCRYFQPLAFPDRIEAGLRVDSLGRSSVRYAVGIFRSGEDAAAAAGHFIHVYVDRRSRRPAALPEPMRAALSRIAAQS